MKRKLKVVPYLLLAQVILSSIVFAQTPVVRSENVISGTVVDQQTRENLSGVTVSIAGSSTATFTDSEGQFRIKATTGDELIFSFIGMASKTLKVSRGMKPLMVGLEADAILLGDVVATGYQTISKERATGSFSKITAKSIENQRLDNLNTVLEGRVPGYTNGLIRGTTSMKGMTNPLFVVDGFPIENTRYNASSNNPIEALPDLNLEDIESITVLKDAAATSIYGARAANGVVVLVTKKAAKGKTEISFSSTFTFSPYSLYKDRMTDAGDIVEIEKEWAASNPNLKGANAATYAARLRKDAIYTSQGRTSILDFYTGKLSQDQLDNTLNGLSSQGYRYYDDVEKQTKRNPFYQQYNLAIGKSTDTNQFTASVTYKDNKLSDIYSDNQSVGVNIANSMNLTKWLTFDIGTYNSYQTKDVQSYSASSPGYKYMPYDGLVNADGSRYTSTGSSRIDEDKLAIMKKYGFYSMDITPLDEIGRNITETNSFSNRTFAKLNIQFTDWLSFNAMFQYEYSSDKSTQLNAKDSYYVRSRINNFISRDANDKAVLNLPYGNIYNSADFYSNAYNYRQQINFNKTFSEKHDVTAFIGSETRHSKLEYANQTLYNYDPDMLSYEQINAKSLSSVSTIWGGYLYASDVAYQRELLNRFVSFYGNSAYTYDGKYMATGSLRWDRSNLWGTDSKYQNKPIWSVGGAWNVDKEAFFQVDWINRLKLRTSYGITGNIAKDAAPFMTANYYQNSNVGGLQGSISKRPNPLLSWEKTTTTNIGLDFALLENRLSGTVEYYNRFGQDLLASTMGVPTEGFGYSTYAMNNGEMRNRGVEITLSGDIIRTKEVGWSATFLYGYNKNKVVYVNVTAPVYYLQLDYPESYPRIGNAYTALYSYKWAGLNEKGLPQVYNEKGEKTTSTPNTLDAIVYSGSTVPTHSGSFSSNFRYKEFDFSFLLIYQTGHKMRNTDLPFLNSTYSSLMGSYITDIAVVNKRITNRWRQAGDEAITDIPRIVFSENPDYSSSTYSLYSKADINVISASNIRLSNISFSYTLPTELCRKVFLRDAKLRFNVENLLTIADSKEAKYLLGGYNSPNYVWGLSLNF